MTAPSALGSKAVARDEPLPEGTAPVEPCEIRAVSSIEQEVSPQDVSCIPPPASAQMAMSSETDKALVEISELGVNIRMPKDVDPTLLTKVLRALKEA